MVERNNRGLGDSLRAMLLGREQEDWDTLLPHLMRAYRGTPHTATGETANMLMLGRELRLPDQLQYQPPPEESRPRHEFVVEIKDRLEQAHEALRQHQLKIRQDDQEEPLLFAVGDLVWLQNRRRRKGENPKLQQKFVGPYEVVEAYDNHTYKIDKQGQTSVQSETRLKLYRPCEAESGRAPASLEPRRRPNMRGALKPRDKRTMSEEAETTLDLPPVTVPDTLGPQETEEPAVETPVESNAETETPAVTHEPAPEAAPTRPSRVTKKPIRFNDYECYPCSSELPTTGEVTVSENGEKKSAWSRPGGSPQTGHSRSGTGSKETVGGSPWSIVPTLIREDADRLSTQEWPELPQERQDIKEPVRSRLPGLPPEIPGRMTREASSQATTCKKQFGSRTNGSLRISNQNSELFYEAQEFPQEVRDETGTMWSFTEKADSVNVPGRTSKNNLAEKDFEFGHLHSTKMENGAEDTRDSTDGESDSSLLLALQELSSCVGEAAVGASQHSEWSEQALLSEPDLAVKGALKAAAQVVPQTTNIIETNSQNWLESVIEKKSQRALRRGHGGHCVRRRVECDGLERRVQHRGLVDGQQRRVAKRTQLAGGTPGLQVVHRHAPAGVAQRVVGERDAHVGAARVGDVGLEGADVPDLEVHVPRRAGVEIDVETRLVHHAVAALELGLAEPDLRPDKQGFDLNIQFGGQGFVYNSTFTKVGIKGWQ